VHVARVPFDEIVARTPGEPSAAIRTRVERARTIQRTRFAGYPHLTNAAADERTLRAHADLGADAIALLREAAGRGNLSARALDRIARVARTIADLSASPAITGAHVAEAICYRSLERKGLAA